MEQNPDDNVTRLSIVYEASNRIIFDQWMIGNNVFIVEYPEKITGFVVRDSENPDPNSWFVLFLERNNIKLSGDCFGIDSNFGDPYLCPLPIPSEHLLKYVSITNETLWMHTSYNKSLYDQFFETCFLMNDCFGCLILSSNSPFSCSWNSDRCINSADDSVKNATDCIQIEKININNSTRNPRSHILAIIVSGIYLTNALTEIQLLMENGKIILPDQLAINEVEFLLDPGDDGMIMNNLNRTFLVITNSKLDYPIELALSTVRKPDEEIDWRKIIVYVSLFIGGVISLTFISFSLYLCTKKKQDSRIEAPELPDPKVIGGFAD